MSLLFAVGTPLLAFVAELEELGESSMAEDEQRRFVNAAMSIAVARQMTTTIEAGPSRGVDVDSDQERGARLARVLSVRGRSFYRADELGQPFLG